MLKIPLQQNKESLIGYSLFAGAMLLFVLNAYLLIQVLVAVYGVKPVKKTANSIDGTVLSEAVKILKQQE